MSTVIFDSTYAPGLSPANRSRRKTAISPTIWSRPYVRPKKKPAKAIQKTICTGPRVSGPRGSKAPGRTFAGSVTKAQVRQIAEAKIKDLNAHDVDMAMRLIEGSARSMGIEVRE